MARAVSPAHTLVDGDLVFSVSTAARPLSDPIFDPIELTPKKDAGKPGEEEDHRRKKVRKEAAATARASAKDAAVRAGDPDEDKYRLGYGVLVKE